MRHTPQLQTIVCYLVCETPRRFWSILLNSLFQASIQFLFEQIGLFQSPKATGLNTRRSSNNLELDFLSQANFAFRGEDQSRNKWKYVREQSHLLTSRKESEKQLTTKKKCINSSPQHRLEIWYIYPQPTAVVLILFCLKSYIFIWNQTNIYCGQRILEQE